MNTTAEAGEFLKQLLGAEHRGMGVVLLDRSGGANALGNNPAVSVLPEETGLLFK